MPTLSEVATNVMRENVKREIVTHHALRDRLPAPIRTDTPHCLRIPAH